MNGEADDQTEYESDSDLELNKQIEDLEDIMYGIINSQAFQVHKFRRFLGTQPTYTAIQDPVSGAFLNGASLGEQCTPSRSSPPTITETTLVPTANLQPT